MHRRTFLLTGAILASAITVTAQQETSKLDVEVNYTGSGVVDQTHKVFVILWDTPDFVKGDTSGPPIGVQGISSKSDVAHFGNLQKGPAYVSVLYDPSGKWDAASVPPPGSSVGIYSTESGTPTPIKLDPAKAAKVSASFDDSYKMQ